MEKKIITKDQIDKLIQVFRSGDLKKAFNDCKSTLKEFDKEPFLWNLKGMIEIKLNDFNNSIGSFEQALKINPAYVEAYNNIATSLINLGQFKKSISYLKKAINIKPNYANAFNNLASAQIDLGRYEDAIDSFNKLLNFEPNYPGVKQNIIKILTFHNPKKKI